MSLFKAVLKINIADGRWNFKKGTQAEVRMIKNGWVLIKFNEYGMPPYWAREEDVDLIKE